MNTEKETAEEFERLRQTMRKGIEGTQLEISIIGIIDSMEAMGKTPQQALEHIEKLFTL